MANNGLYLFCAGSSVVEQRSRLAAKGRLGMVVGYVPQVRRSNRRSRIAQVGAARNGCVQFVFPHGESNGRQLSTLPQPGRPFTRQARVVGCPSCRDGLSR